MGTANKLKRRSVDYTEDLLEAIKEEEVIDDRPWAAENRALLWEAINARRKRRAAAAKPETAAGV